MAETAIKPEIKLDPGDNTDLADIEQYEEDTDLHVPADPPQGWLARVPPELWQAWSEIYKHTPADERVQLGTLRVYTKHAHLGPQNQRLDLFLSPGHPQTADLPQKYNLKVATSGYTNSAVFSEKDLPGHKTLPFGRSRHLAASKPTGIDKAQRLAASKKFGGYASVIPKQTALAAKINHECNLIPMQDDAHYLAHLERSLTQAMQPKLSTTFQLGVDRGLQPGRQAGIFSSFTTTSKPLKGKKKAQREKFVRMEQKDLFDRLQSCFRRYRYWSLKALRNELKQPEAYIKTSLEQIATLIRSGDFSMQYVLKPEYASSLSIKDEDVKDEVAKVENSEGETDMASGEEEDDDLGELEDVKMEN